MFVSFVSRKIKWYLMFQQLIALHEILKSSDNGTNFRKHRRGWVHLIGFENISWTNLKETSVCLWLIFCDTFTNHAVLKIAHEKINNKKKHCEHSNESYKCTNKFNECQKKNRHARTLDNNNSSRQCCCWWCQCRRHPYHRHYQQQQQQQNRIHTLSKQSHVEIVL